MARKKQDQQEDGFDFLSPDKTRLDVEWTNQPKLFYDYACQLAGAREGLDEMRASLDVVKAEIDKAIRDNPADYGIEKLTETLISNTIVQQPDFQRGQKEVRRMKHNVDILQAAVTALDHRKAALEKLVSLHGQSYFATPRASDEDSREFVSDAEKQAARSKVGKKGRRG